MADTSQALYNVLYLGTCQSQEEGILYPFIFQIRKTRVRGESKLPKVTQLVGGGTGVCRGFEWQCCLPEPPGPLCGVLHY